MTALGPLEPYTSEAGSPPMELADAVEAIRIQIVDAMSRGQGKSVQFTVGDLELEFAVLLTQDRSVNGGIKVWVINAGGSASTSTATTHRVKVTLKPIDPRSGEPPKISDYNDPTRSH